MAKCAEEALLAAIEVYNKPLVSYREHTVALLLVNAWEVLLKARIVQGNGNDLSSIYRREGRKFKRSADGSHRTIGLRQAMTKASIGSEIRQSLEGLLLVRNQAAHAGDLPDGLRRQVHAFAAGAVQNFAKCADEWFGLQARVPYLLPVGFLSDGASVQATGNTTQRHLLKRLRELAATPVDAESGFVVTLRVTVALNPLSSGGGTIGATSDPNAPKVRLTDDELLKKYSLTHADVVKMCRREIPGFKQAQRFNDAMKQVKKDPECAHQRKLDPRSSKDDGRWFYDPKVTLALLERKLGGDSA